MEISFLQIPANHIVVAMWVVVVFTLAFLWSIVKSIRSAMRLQNNRVYTSSVEFRATKFENMYNEERQLYVKVHQELLDIKNKYSPLVAELNRYITNEKQVAIVCHEWIEVHNSKEEYFQSKEMSVAEALRNANAENLEKIVAGRFLKYEIPALPPSNQ